MPRLRCGCWPWLWCLRALIGHARRRVAGWIVRRFGEADQETFRGTVSPPNGFIAITQRVWRVFRTAGRGPAFRALRLRRWRNSQPSVEAGPDPERRRGGALAAERSGTPDCLDLRGRGARAHGRHLERVRQKWTPVLSPDTRKNKRLESVWRFCHRQTDSIWRHWGIAGCRSRPQHPKTDPLAQEAFKKTAVRR